MPTISNKGQNMPASPIRKLIPFAEKAKAKGTHIYHLNIGQPDIKTPKSMINAIKNIDFEVLAYSHSGGIESYRRKLATYYAKHDIDVAYTDILVTTGGSEAILFALSACLDAGDEIIVPEPFYANYNGFSLANGIKIKPITAKIQDNFALPAIEDFEKQITAKTKAIFICNPSNPTGYVYTKEELLVLKEIVIKHDLFLFADEVYREFVYDEETAHTSILTLAGLEEHAIVVDSISKRYSACGARIGTLVAKNKAVISTALKFGQARLSPPTLGQIGAEAALDEPDTYLQNVITEYKQRRDTLIKALQNIDGVFCPSPKGAFYTIAQLPITDSEHFCQWLLEDFSYQGETVMLAPAAGFYATPNLGKQEVRIAYVLKEEDLKKAITCLAEALKVYPYRTNKTAEKAGSVAGLDY